MTVLTRRAALRALAGSTGLAAFGGPAFAAETFDINVGALYPMSGPNAAIGENANNALRSALEIVEGDYDLDLPLARADHLPGIPGARLKYLLSDHKGDPATARAAAARLITENKVIALIGCGDEKIAEVLTEVCDKSGVAFIDTDSNAQSLRQRPSQFSFRFATDEAIRAATLFDFFDHLRQDAKADVRSIALLHDKEPDDIRAAQMLRAAAMGRKTAITAEAPHLRGRADQSRTAAEKLRQEVDAIILIGSAHDSMELAALVADAAKGAPLICYPASTLDRVIGQAPESGQGLFFMKGFARDIRDNDPNIAAINTLDRSFGHRDLDELAALQFTGFLTLAFAINEARNASPAKIAQRLGAVDQAGNRTIMPWERLIFDGKGQNTGAGVVLSQRQGDRLATVFPGKLATAIAHWKA